MADKYNVQRICHANAITLLPTQGYMGTITQNNDDHTCFLKKEKGTKSDSIIRNMLEPCKMFAREGYFYDKYLPIYELTRQKYMPTKQSLFSNIYAVEYDIQDNTCCIIMDNLTKQGFNAPIDCEEGFTLTQLLHILEALALFHVLSYKTLENLNEDENKSLLNREWYTSTLSDIAPLYKNGLDGLVKRYSESYEESVGLYRAAFDRVFVRQKDVDIKSCSGSQPLVLSHGDLFCQNVMLKDSCVKFIDFQAVRIGHIGEDICFLLTIGADFMILEKEFATLVKHYYTHLKENFYLLGIGRVFENLSIEDVKKNILEHVDHSLAMSLPSFNFESIVNLHKRLIENAKIWNNLKKQYEIEST